MKSQRQNKEFLESYYHNLAPKYDEVTTSRSKKWNAPETANELILPHAKPGDGVLDIGVGTGQSARALYEKGCKITGIDICSYLELARYFLSKTVLRFVS